MRALSILRLSWNAVGGHPLCTFLSALGVTWGVLSFLILVSYGDGFQRAMELGMKYYGDNVCVVWNGQTSLQAGGQKAGKSIQMELPDVELLRQGAPLIKRVSPEVFRNYTMVAEQRRVSGGVRGVESCYGAIRGMIVEEGRFFNDDDNAQLARVAVLGSDLRTRLFSQMPAVGQYIKINGMRFLVIGVLHKKIALSNYFMPDDMCAMVPVRSMATLTDIRNLSVMVWQPVSPAFEEGATRQFMSIMGARHRFDPADDKALHVNSFSEFKSIIGGIAAAVKVTVMFVGAITLCIGGVGVMNIMLVSVKSRTREIGTLKALGAKRRQIIGQFLAETMLMTVLGGLAGYALAVGMAALIGHIPFLSGIFEDKTGQGDIFLVVSWSSFMISMGVLGAVSLVFGLMPAVQAARKQPVEALRYE